LGPNWASFPVSLALIGNLRGKGFWEKVSGKKLVSPGFPLIPGGNWGKNPQNSPPELGNQKIFWSGGSQFGNPGIFLLTKKIWLFKRKRKTKKRVKG